MYGYKTIADCDDHSVNELFEKIESALDIKLYPWQKAYILYGSEESYDGSKASKTGRTTAAIIKTILDATQIIRIETIVPEYKDGLTEAEYDDYYFGYIKEFKRIHSLLYNYKDTIPIHSLDTTAETKWPRFVFDKWLDQRKDKYMEDMHELENCRNVDMARKMWYLANEIENIQAAYNLF